MAISASPDIEIRLHLSNIGDVPADLVVDTLRAVNDAVYASERADLRAWREEFPELPSVALDAAEHRLREFRASSVRIRAIDHGSLEIAIVVTGLAVWILQATLGETLKQAWLDSPMHSRLKSVLAERRLAKLEDVRHRATTKLQRKLPASLTWREIRPISDLAAPLVIEVDVVFMSGRDYPPSRSEAFRRWEMRDDGKRRK